MGSEQRHAVSSQLGHLLAHLLKLRYSPARHPRRGWIVETQNARDEIAVRLETSPGLRAQLPRLLDEEWPRARRTAVLKMDVYGEQADLPRECPFTLEQVLDDDYRPGRAAVPVPDRTPRRPGGDRRSRSDVPAFALPHHDEPTPGSVPRW